MIAPKTLKSKQSQNSTHVKLGYGKSNKLNEECSRLHVSLQNQFDSIDRKIITYDEIQKSAKLPLWMLMIFCFKEKSCKIGAVGCVTDW